MCVFLLKTGPFLSIGQGDFKALAKALPDCLKDVLMDIPKRDLLGMTVAVL